MLRGHRETKLLTLNGITANAQHSMFTGSSAVMALVHGCPLYGMYLNLEACYCINEAGIASLQLAHLHLQALQHTKAVMNAVLVNFQWFTKYTTLQQQNTSEHCKVIGLVLNDQQP